jgi:uncharacterized protein (DUF983 family)
MTKECEICGDEFEAEVDTEDACEDCLASMVEDEDDDYSADFSVDEQDVDNGA